MCVIAVGTFLLFINFAVSLTPKVFLDLHRCGLFNQSSKSFTVKYYLSQ